MTQFLDLLKPGMTVYLAGTSGEPTAILESLKIAPAAMRGVHFVTTFIPGINEFDLLSLNGEATNTVFFMQPHLSRYLQDPRLRYIPLNYFGIDRYLRSMAALDLAVIQTTPPDSARQCNLGPCVDFSRTVFDRAHKRVALANRSVPHLPRSPQIAVGEFDFVIEADCPVKELRPPTLDAVAERIGVWVASLIRDGDTLQTGIGKVPSQVLLALTQKRRLRIHSGVILEPIKLLHEHGALDPTCAKVAPVAVGSTSFYKWLYGRSDIELRDVSNTHSPAVLAQIDRFVSINSAVEVDLMGQVNAESAGNLQISGPGGLADFSYMAHRSPGGRSIIALPSTNSKESISRIVSRLHAANPITLGRLDVDFVVTEFGIAELVGRTPEERQQALIQIAHPKFREELARTGI